MSTDAEHEGQIRAAIQTMTSNDSFQYRVLLRLLDEARADCTTACELAQTVTDDLTEAQAQIARLQAPPGASAMEQARYLALAITKLPASEALASWWAGDVAPIMARAIERAKSETARLYLGWCELCQVYHRTGNCDKTGQPPSKEARESWSALPEKDWPVIRRWLDEARAKAIEEAAHFHAQQLGNPGMRKIEAEAIRALAKPSG